MPPLSPEWTWWALVNGVLGSGLVFALVIPALRNQYPWTVEHPESAVFLVTGFLMRGAIFAHITLADHWIEIRWITVGTTVYGLILLAASMVYGDRFHWGKFLAIMWFILYLEEPVWMLTLVPDAETALLVSSAAADFGEPLNPALIGMLWVQAAVMAAAGLSLLFGIRTTTVWPWQPDRVSAIVIAGFPIGWSFWSAALAGSAGWAEAEWGVWIDLFWLALVFGSLLVFRKQFDFSQGVTRRFALVTGLLLAGLAAGVILQY